MKRDNRGTQDKMRTKRDRVLTASQQAAEKRPRNGEPPMNADERPWKTNALSAFIGVYRRPEMAVSGRFPHPALTAFRRDRARKEQGCHRRPEESWRAIRDAARGEKKLPPKRTIFSGEPAPPLNPRSIGGLAKIRTIPWPKSYPQIPRTIRNIRSGASTPAISVEWQSGESSPNWALAAKLFLLQFFGSEMVMLR